MSRSPADLLLPGDQRDPTDRSCRNRAASHRVAEKVFDQTGHRSSPIDAPNRYTTDRSQHRQGGIDAARAGQPRSRPKSKASPRTAWGKQVYSTRDDHGSARLAGVRTRAGPERDLDTGFVYGIASSCRPAGSGRRAPDIS